MFGQKLTSAALVFLMLTACGGGSSNPPPVTTTPNAAPVADAGEDRAVEEATVITLDASGSSDPDGDPLTYSWAQISGDAEVVFSSTSIANPDVEIPNLLENTVITLELTVSDGRESATDTVLLTIAADNDAPEIVLGEDRTVAGGTAAMFDASETSDPEGEELIYTWSVTGGSPIFIGGLLDQPRLHLYFPADLAGQTVELELSVDDGANISSKALTVTIADCHDGAGTVFVDCVDPTWSGPSAFERHQVSDEINVYVYSDATHHVQWEFIDLEDGDHNNVIEVTFNHDDTNGIFRFLKGVPGANEIIDMRAFAGGDIVFDLRVFDLGETDLRFKIECVWPCESADIPLDVVADGEWQTVTIPVDNLVAVGLDLSKVDVAFEIFPVWGSNQQNVRLQLDNIRWRAPDDVLFDDAVGSGWGGLGAWDEVNLNYDDGDTAHHITWSIVDATDVARGQVIDVQFNHDMSGTFFVFYQQQPENAATDMSVYKDGQLTFDFRVLEYGTNTAGFVASVHCGHPCFSGDFDIGRPALNEWTNVTIPVADMVEGGLDLEAVSDGFMILPAWGEQEGVRIQVDDIRWQAEVQ